MVNENIFIWMGLFIGSVVGSYVPILWDESVFSMTSLLFGTVGGFLGIWVGFKFTQWIDL